MSDAVEAGPGGVEKDAVELAEELRDPRNGSLRAVVRRIEALRTLIDGQGDSLRGRIARGEDRLDALEKAETQHAGKAETMDSILELDRRLVARVDLADRRSANLSYDLGKVDRTVSAQGQRIGALESLLAAEAMRRAMNRACPLPSDTSSPELAERRGAGPHRDTRVRGALVRCSRLGCAVVLPTNIERKDGTYAALCDQHCVGATIDAVIHRAPDLPPADDFLTPPPIARAIGKAITEHANRRSFETIRKAEDEVKAAATLSRACERIRDFWEKDGGKDGLLVSLVEGLIMATAEAKRAGVIP